MPIPFLAGLALLGALWLGPLPGLASHSFTAHMVMHLGVLAVASPMLALGLPRLAAALARRSSPVTALAASAAEFIVVWAWHAPAAHTVARNSSAGLIAEQGSFLAVGLLLWASVLGPPGQNRESAGAGILALLLTSMHMTLLGALIALAPRDLYHGHHHRAVAGTSDILHRWFDLTPLADQQLGGAVMLLVAGSVYLVVGVWRLNVLLTTDPKSASTIS